MREQLTVYSYIGSVLWGLAHVRRFGYLVTDAVVVVDKSLAMPEHLMSLRDSAALSHVTLHVHPWMNFA